MAPKVSIVIPVRIINDYIREAIPYYLAMDFQEFEILIFPNTEPPDGISFPKTRIISSGQVGPAEKRDMSLTYAEGSLLAFIDDDAFPRKDWLSNAIRNFQDPAVGAVGGPAVTPPDEETLRKASGCVYESALCSGCYVYRYLPRAKREVDDFPSVNLIVRRDVFAEVGGFDSKFYPGEDTKLCLDITKKLGKKIIYDPEVVVWHHRRRLFGPHLAQIKNYARHRGYFARKFPVTSFRIAYFVPTFFVLGLFLGPFFGWLIPLTWWIYTGVLVFYFWALLISGLRVGGICLMFLTMVGIFLTHLTYGVYFISGLCSKIDR